MTKKDTLSLLIILFPVHCIKQEKKDQIISKSKVYPRHPDK